MLWYFLLYALGDFLSLRVQFSNRAKPVVARGGGCGHPALPLGCCLHTQLHGSCLWLFLEVSTWLISASKRAESSSFLYHINFLLIYQSICSACLVSTRVDAGGKDRDGGRRSRTIPPWWQMDITLAKLVWTVSVHVQLLTKKIFTIFIPTLFPFLWDSLTFVSVLGADMQAYLNRGFLFYYGEVTYEGP